jgi:hypothetical protein
MAARNPPCTSVVSDVGVMDYTLFAFSALIYFAPGIANGSE